MTSAHRADPEDRIQLTLTLQQASAVAEALDAFSRLGIGQIEELASLISQGVVPARDATTMKAHPATLDQCLAVERQLQDVKALLGYTRGSSLGVGNRGVCDAVHRAWEVKRVLDQALANYRDPSPSFRGVNYDGLIVRYTTDPVPTAVVGSATAIATGDAPGNASDAEHPVSNLRPRPHQA